MSTTMSIKDKARLKERHLALRKQYALVRTDAQIRAQLTRDFYRTMTFFKLPLEVRKVALESARQHWRQAARCYRAIINSLPRGTE